MIRRKAERILIESDIKTDFILDDDGNPAETYEYKEYKVLDGDDNILEVGRCGKDIEDVEEILKMTGIKFGVSEWITF